MSYAVVWKEPDRPAVPGRLELGDGYLVLSGRAHGGDAARRQLAITELTDVRLERGRDSQTGRGTRRLVLRARDGSSVELKSLEGLGVLHELADELAGHL